MILTIFMQINGTKGQKVMWHRTTFHSFNIHSIFSFFLICSNIKYHEDCICSQHKTNNLSIQTQYLFITVNMYNRCTFKCNLFICFKVKFVKE